MPSQTDRTIAFQELRSKRLADAVSDAHPALMIMEEKGGMRTVTGGSSVIEAARVVQNPNVGWKAEGSQVGLLDPSILGEAEYDWAYLMGAYSFTHAEKLMNRGGNYHDLLQAKQDTLEDTLKNKLEEGLQSAGTGDGGLQLDGLPALITTTPTSGTVGGLQRSSSDNAWIRNQKFDTAADWSLGAASATNMKRLLAKAIDLTKRGNKTKISCFLLGQTYWEFANQFFEAVQGIENVSGTGKLGFDKMVYRGIPIYQNDGLNFSGFSGGTDTRGYGLCLEEGGFNLVWQEGAKFKVLPAQQSHDQVAYASLNFSMLCTTLGGLAKHNIVMFD